MVMTDRDDKKKREELPDGLIKPGRMTTTADPVMRKKAEAVIRKYEGESNQA